MAAIINSKSQEASSVRLGLIIKLPFFLPMRTSEIISWIGISETANAADAARQANPSGNTSASLDKRLIKTCTSHK